MGPSSQSNECRHGSQGNISHYHLDFQRNGSNYYYIWRHNPYEAAEQLVPGLLIDLNNVCIPEPEIEKMVLGFVGSACEIISIAIINCHAGNQQDIRRKLKTGDMELYSRTAFFTDLHKAQQWLKAQCAGS